MAEAKGESKDEGEEAAAPAALAPGKKKLWIIIGGVVALLLVIGVPVAFFTLAPAEKTSEELAADAALVGEHTVPEGHDDEDEFDEGEEPLGALFPFESIVVNLSGGGYLRTQIQVEFVERDIPKRFYMRLVPIRDSLIALLAARKADQLGSQTGRDTLKTEIKEVINETLRKQEVKNVYFTQFVIQ